jgi:hypothetical protein
MDIRVRMIDIPQLLTDSPMPVGTETISPPIPYSKNKPGKCRERNGDQMDFSCFRKHPSHHIKNRKYGMEYKEENIQELVPNHEL